MTVTRVQGNQASAGSNVTTLTVTLAAGITQGNLVAVAAATGNNTTTISGPSGWAQAVINQPAGASAAIETSIWWIVVSAAQAGQTSWIFTLSAAHSEFLCIEEWNASSGWPASPVDQTAQGDTAGTPTAATVILSGTTAATAQAEELAVASLAYKGSAQAETGVTSGWTSDLEATAATKNTMTMLYNVLSATGTQACQYTIGTAQFWAGVIATFQTAAAAAATPAPLVVPQAAVMQAANW